MINKYLENDDEVIIPDKIDGLPVTAIALMIFADKDLKSVTIPDTVTTIDMGAFMNCKNLKNVNLGDGVIEIKREAFTGCVSLESITLPESLEVIGIAAFQECTSLKKVFVPKNVTKIDSVAFRHCNSLEEVIISGDNVEIEFNAFDVDRPLNIKFLGDAPQIDHYTYNWDDAKVTFYYKKGTKGWDDPIFDKCNLVEYS